MMLLWRLLRFLPPGWSTFIKRHSSSGLRFWLRQHLGADYAAIPDQVCTVPDGRRFHIGPDWAYWPLYMGMEHEPEATSAARQLVRPGDVVIDVGANYGWFTTLFAQAVGPTGHVYAFEPVPATYERLLEHLDLNQLRDRVTTESAALGDAPGHVTVYVFKTKSTACASLSTLGVRDHQAVEAPLLRLDDYCRDHQISRVDFLKCDVEGAEMLALKGAGSLLEGPDAPVLLVEINDETSQAFGYTRQDMWRFLAERGYDHFYDMLSTGKLNRIHAADALQGSNLLCAKQPLEARLSGAPLAAATSARNGA